MMVAKKCYNYDYAFDMGVDARKSGTPVGCNPFTGETDQKCYEAWLDGWTSITPPKE